MCIAIVKPKGINILEEHLYNGWLINDDGAGFACITNEGDFFIHKSMTWEGFIDVYKNAVKDFGDTSDFLIHFRITSKGDTTLSNCHPFIVDEDRVIIHNGTMYNIAIDKDDPRSDTKVFAEDWLSQLPAAWEDNAVLRVMIEDFIGASKIALLHRTKGVTIFNADKGVWDKGIWYSNKTYIAYTPNAIGTQIFDYYTNTWVEKGYYKKQKQKQNKNIIVDINNQGWTKCGCCGEYDKHLLMKDMNTDYPGQFWCDDCFIKSIICDCCNKRCDEKDVDYYFSEGSTEPTVVCDNCMHYYDAQDMIGNLKKNEEKEVKDLNDKIVSA